MSRERSAMLVQAVMHALDGVPVSAVLIYGSVAKGTDRADSDVDTFVLLSNEVDARLRYRLRADFRDLQLRLGYRPDALHPVELFSIDAVAAALDLVEVAALDGTLSALLVDGDEREVLGALCGPRLLIQGGDNLDRFTARALRLARLFPVEVPV